MCGWRVALMSSYGCRSATSHVIPRRLIQTLNLHRWNCNVFGVSRKMTAINYVRDFAGGGVAATSGPGALMCGWRVALMSSYGCRSATSHVIPRRLIQTLNLHRWNCNVFGVSRKMTAINYVRDFAGGGVAATSGPRSQARWFSQHPSRRRRWGFCTTRSPQGARRRRVGPSCSANPPRLKAERLRLEAV